MRCVNSKKKFSFIVSHFAVFRSFVCMAEFRGGGGGWVGFGHYMRDKTSKLAGQFAERYSIESTIFIGKTFWSTGRLDGFDLDIKELITAHGGTYEQYGLRNVSHIVASNLALSNQNWKKLLGGKFASKPYSVVTPQWVVDSIRANKCLPEADYLPSCISQHGSLISFLREPCNSIPNVKSSDSLDVQTSRSTDAVQSIGRIFRIEVSDPNDSVSVVEEFCGELVDSPYEFSGRVYVTIACGNAVSINCLDLSEFSAPLSESLLAELSGINWDEVSRIAVTLHTSESRAVAMDILPTDSCIHPTSITGRILSLSQELSGIADDTMKKKICQVLHEAGPCAHNILLDVFTSLVRDRRLDQAENLVRSLFKIRNETLENRASDWLGMIHSSMQRIFGFYNDGAILM